MIDGQLREVLQRPLRWGAARVDVRGITPNGLTGLGLVVGLASAALAAFQLWWLALAAWLISRVLDGLDGALARRRQSKGDAEGSDQPASELGGFLDIVADFTVYGATVFGVAIGVTNGFGASWWPFLLVLLSYYLNGAAFLAFSSIAERTGRQIDDGRSLSFLGRLAEGTETIVVHSLWLIFPTVASQTAVVWAAFVLISAAERVFRGTRLLR